MAITLVVNRNLEAAALIASVVQDRLNTRFAGPSGDFVINADVFKDHFGSTEGIHLRCDVTKRGVNLQASFEGECKYCIDMGQHGMDPSFCPTYFNVTGTVETIHSNYIDQLADTAIRWLIGMNS